MVKQILILLVAVTMLQACKKVPITGRNQLNFINDDNINAQAVQQYNLVLDQSRVIEGTANSEMVKRVGERIENAVIRFMKANGLEEQVADWQWEYNLIDEGVANAWAMPGGKVAFYTGILPITEDEQGLAVVMGHEIAHAIARHGSERMSQSTFAQVGQVAAAVGAGATGLNAQGQQDFMRAFGLGTSLGILKFSRTHESEADQMGLIFMAMAGYDPREAPIFWQRMAEQSGGQAPPEFLSTHPSNATRIADLNSHMEEALLYYKPANGSRSN